MNKLIYLLEANDNGYGINRELTYFSSEVELDQKKVNQLIRLGNPIAGRVGSWFCDLEEGAKKSGIKIEKLEGFHRITDALEVFKNVEGNY
jgi:hypothetical protein